MSSPLHPWTLSRFLQVIRMHESAIIQTQKFRLLGRDFFILFRILFQLPYSTHIHFWVTRERTHPYSFVWIQIDVAVPNHSAEE